MKHSESQSPRISELLPGFGEYMVAERRFSPATIAKYHDGIRWFLRDVGNRPVVDIGMQDFITLKAKMAARGTQESRMGGVISAAKNLLIYARDVLKLPVTDLSAIKLPRSPRREVVYLTNEELKQFMNAIPLRTWDGRPRIAGLRFRALVEVLASSGMRISEALALDRTDVDFENGEARIIGKGNKERTVYFNERSREWVGRYLELREDTQPALFATRDGARLGANSIQAVFRRNTKWSGLDKHVTPHIIRHTTATNLLRNGCPIGHIKELLGHERLETTCQFYLGILDSADVKKAHYAYQNFDVDFPEAPPANSTTPLPPPSFAEQP